LVVGNDEVVHQKKTSIELIERNKCFPPLRFFFCFHRFCLRVFLVFVFVFLGYVFFGAFLLLLVVVILASFPSSCLRNQVREHVTTDRLK